VIKLLNTPKNKFRAYYMDSKDPKKVIYSEEVDDISLNFDRKGFHGIKAEYLASLWIGDFTFKEKTTKEISFSLSWAKINVIIDGKSVYKGSHSKSFLHTFEKGTHRVEIEFNSNYPHVGFLFTMNDVMKKLDEDTFKYLDKDTKIYVIGVYSSPRDDHGLDIKIRYPNRKSVLIIGSYEPVKWNIINAKNVQAVIFNSHKPGTSIKSDNKNLKIYQDKNLHYVSRLLPYCYDKPITHCENKYSFTNAVKYVQRVLGKRPDGFSSLSFPSLSFKRLIKLDTIQPIIVPEFKLNAEMYMKIKEKMGSLD